MAEYLDAKLVVVVSRSGATALTRSNQRGFVPTVGISQSLPVLRRMSLFWGITPLQGAPADRVAMQEFAVDWAQQEGMLHSGDRVVVISGTNVERGAHNTLVLFEVE